MSKYTDLITNYHRGKPLFTQHVDLSTRPLTDVSTSLSTLIAAFDIDTATGNQLDILGEWIGRSRTVSEPISGIYFSFDEDGIGFDQGVWQGPYDPDEGFTQLSDDVYRFVLKVKIAINQWDGKNDTVTTILDNALAGSGLRLVVVDNQDMTISIWGMPEALKLNDTDILILDNALNGSGFIQLPDGYTNSVYVGPSLQMVSRELLAVIRMGYMTIKAAGVYAGEIVTPSEGSQFFGFDIENEYIAGFDAGAWEMAL